MRSKLLSPVIIGLGLSYFSQAAVANEMVSHIDDFTAKYNIVHDGDIVGKAVRTLKNLPDGSFDFNYKTDIEWLIFSDHRREITTNKIVNGQVIPLTYKSDREGTGKDKFYEWQFDADNKTAYNVKKNNKPMKGEWVDGLQSKLSYHLQSRINLINKKKDFNFKALSSSGKVSSYHYEYLGTEELLLPYGVLDTVKLKRKKPGSKRVTYAWFAPELNYMMVKLHQIESSFQQFQAELVSVDPDVKKAAIANSEETNKN
ncbi:hypothetical protein A9Q98_01910 [Thalassotalea sp. 42_200_T64]|nr:hypothetical protein A9Q98_01910 [Thalassotalea sp. 42_200_T64]